MPSSPRAAPRRHYRRDLLIETGICLVEATGFECVAESWLDPAVTRYYSPGHCRAQARDACFLAALYHAAARQCADEAAEVPV